MDDEKIRLLAVGRYASDARPSHQPFVRALLMELAAQGVEVTVVAPEPLAGLLKRSSGHRLAPVTEMRDGIPIHRPRYLGYSAVRLPLLGSTRRLSDRAYRRAALRAALGLGQRFDLCYGHFLYPHGAAALAIGRRLGIPAIVSLGESSFARYEAGYDTETISRLLRRFDGVIANSPELSERCTGIHGVPASAVRQRGRKLRVAGRRVPGLRSLVLDSRRGTYRVALDPVAFDDLREAIAAIEAGEKSDALDGFVLEDMNGGGDLEAAFHISLEKQQVAFRAKPK